MSYKLAQYLDEHVGKSESVRILAGSYTMEDLKLYLAKVQLLDGEKGLKAARERLLEMDSRSVNYQRTLIHSHLGKRR